MEKEKTNRKLRFVLSSILSFLMSILLTVGTIMIAIKLGFLNETSILDGMSEKNYFKGAEQEFYQDAKDFTIPIGLPVEVVDGIVDSETVYDDIQAYVTAAVHNKGYSFNTDELESRLTANIYDYFKKEGLQMNEEQIATVPQYTNLIAEIYVENMKVSYVNLLGKVNASYGSYLWIGAFICLLISAIIVIFLIRMYHWKHRAIRFVIYATLAATVLVVSPAVIVAVIGNVMKPNISPEHLYYALVNYCANGLKIFVFLAIGWAVVSAALMLLIRYLKKNN